MWNRDIRGAIERSGLVVESVSTYHFGTTFYVVGSPSANLPPRPSASEATQRRGSSAAPATSPAVARGAAEAAPATAALAARVTTGGAVSAAAATATAVPVTAADILARSAGEALRSVMPCPCGRCCRGCS